MVRKWALKYHFQKWVTYQVFSQWANQPETACLYLILSISSSVSWFSVLSLSSDSLSLVLRFEPLTLSLTHPRTYTHMLPLTFTKRKIHQLDSWSFLFLASFWSYMSLCISTKLSHTFTHTFLKRGAVSISCPFWQHGSLMLFTHNTQTPVHVCFDRSALRHWQGLPWGTAQKTVSNPDSSQTHTSTRMDEWSAQALDFVHRMLTYLTAESNLLSAHSQINTMQLRIQQSWSHQ